MEWWQRLDQEREARGWSGAELARRAKLPYANINKYLNGEIEQPRGKVMQRLADAIDKPMLWLRDGVDSASTEVTPTKSRLVPVAVVGKVEAGAFREVNDMDQSQPEFISVSPDDRFPSARLMAFDVSGDSMNDLKPRPIFPGDRVICVSYEDIAHDAVLRDGMVVIVQRSRDGGQTIEWSVKQVEIYADRTEFHPRSTASRHKPIVVRRDMSADEGVSVEVIGLVRRVVNDLPF